MGWLLEAPTMLVGIDVTHPSIASPTGTPSIAAVVANVDDEFAQYPASMTIHQADRDRRDKNAAGKEVRVYHFPFKSYSD